MVMVSLNGFRFIYNSALFIYSSPSKGCARGAQEPPLCILLLYSVPVDEPWEPLKFEFVCIVLLY